MLNKIVITFVLSLFVIGCTPNIKEYDAEKLEYDQTNKLKLAQKKEDPFRSPNTPPYVKVAEDEDEHVYIEVIKLKPIKNKDGIKLDVWTVNAINQSPEPKCVIVNWKLQDFEFETEQPIEFLLKGKEVLPLGKMKQSIWSFDGAMIAIPPSGYVDSLKIRAADIDKDTHRLTCDMLEEDIDSPKKDTDAIEM